MKRYIFFAILLFFIVSPHEIKANIGRCQATEITTPYGKGACIDPGWHSLTSSTSDCREISPYTSDSFEKALLTLASSGDIAQAVCDARYYLYNLSPDAYKPFIPSDYLPLTTNYSPSSLYYAIPGSGELSQEIKDKYTGSASNIQSVTFNWESLGDVDVSNKDDKRKYARKIGLTINVNGLISDSLTYNISFFGSNQPFKISGSSNGSIRDNVTRIEMIVYSEELITDISTVRLKATVTLKNKSLALHLCNGVGTYPVQRFISISNKDNSQTFNSPTYSFEVSKTCQYKVVDENGVETPKYELHITNPTTDTPEVQVVDALTYMTKGCCSDVEPKFFNVNTPDGREALNYYKDHCMVKDIVSFENNCPKKFEYNQETKKCEEKVVREADDFSYTQSYVLQVPMKTIIDKFLKTTSFENINNDNETLRYYYDENLSNKYCKVLTSEDNEIYFPTTAVATSGRFFVFQELKDTKECTLTGLNYNSKNCFRQPYVKGTIHLYVVNNYSAWLSDYNAAVSERNKYCSGVAIDEKEGLSNNVKCNEAINRVRDLENAKNTCENNVNNFNYDLEPTLTFSYEQDSPNQGLITEEIEMYATKDTDQPVKYWPNVSSKTEIYTNPENSIGKYSFSSDNYQTAYTKTVYYRPSINSFSLLPSGAIHEQTYEAGANVLENGIDVGYVYNVNVTTYEGVYNTWFNISNLGNGRENSKLNQMVVSEYKAAQDLNNLKSTCTYCNEEGSFSRECPTCEELDANFIFRNISLQNVVPNEREYNTNWVDEKGNAAAFMIEQNSGNRLALNDKANNQIKLVAMETSTNNDQMIADIYNDPSQEYLEYDITLTANDIKTIKANNRKYDYAEIKMCDNNSRNDTKSEDAQYCYVCNKDGKECESTFIDAYSNMSVTTESRKNKWKYFFYNQSTGIGEFKKGSMATIEEFDNGRYPDPENQLGYINTYKNWP